MVNRVLAQRSGSNTGGSPVHSDRAIAFWLLLCCGLVFSMVVVGGVTRLTHSGLSMVEWQPLVGTIPPLGEVQWQEVFDKYKKTPEFQQVNFDMGLAEFKGIYWWEYFHRLLGRLIGVVFLLPYSYFLLRRQLRGSVAWKLAAIFILGGLQGAMGWYMVQSGLVDDPRVSQYRLTAHLGLALLIYAPMLWVALDLLFPRRQATRRPRLRQFSQWLVALVFITALTGGFVAGIRAGYAYNTFPLMNGYLIPPESLLLDPWYLNFFNNMAMVQFDHRLLAWLLAVLVPWFWWMARRAATSARARLAAHVLLVATVLQIVLGIATLLSVVPIALAAAHQAGAVAVFTAALFSAHSLQDA